MKRAIFLSVLLMIFSLALFAQKGKTDFCPVIVIAGPSEITVPGETMSFSVNVESENYKQLKYIWKVDRGTIIAGQGTKVITVDRSGLDGGVIKATAEIVGLPENCPKTVSEEGVFPEICYFPVTLEAYGSLSFSDEKIRLKNIAFQLISEMPDSNALFLIYYSENESPQKLKTKIENIADYLTKELKIPQNRYTFLFAPGDSNLTMVYTAPPDSESEQMDWKKELEKIASKNPNH